MNYKKGLFISYIIYLGFCVGAISIAGAITAPVVFNANDYLGADILSKFQSGLIMTEIFVKLNYLIFGLAFFVMFMEMKDYLNFKRDYISLLFMFLIVCTSLLFVLYYTPYILQAQQIGEEFTKSEAFSGMHKGSELDFKILLISTFGLLVRKLIKATK
jgi:ABC-type multidrug transport system permease subunit